MLMSDKWSLLTIADHAYAAIVIVIILLSLFSYLYIIFFFSEKLYVYKKGYLQFTGKF